MNEYNIFFQSMDFEYVYKHGKYRLFFQKDSNIFKYLSKENKYLEYYELVDFFELDNTEKQIMETLREKGFFLIGEFDSEKKVPIQILKFIFDNNLEPSKVLSQIERTNKNKTLIYVKLSKPKKESIEKIRINKYINNILKK